MACFGPVPATEARVLRAWNRGEQCMACLSVRSAFDLVLQALPTTDRDEVVFSALTHPDMVRIAEAHRLKPVPLDIDLETLAPQDQLLESVISSRTRVVVVAHLFGTRVDLSAIAGVAARTGALLVEDSAQRFRGPGEGGDRLADVSLFSLGPIKAATALGGALVEVRDPDLLHRMRAIEASWTRQSRWTYLGRVLRFGGLLAIASPRVYWLFDRILTLSGRNLDRVVVAAVRGFRSDLLGRIRQRPSLPLLAVVERKLRTFDTTRLSARTELAETFAASLPPAVDLPGRRAIGECDWVFPVLVDDPVRLRTLLRREGLDSSSATTSIAAVPAPAGGTAAVNAERFLAHVVFLPVYPELPESERRPLADAVARASA
jgi:dTDP-4-amino-4,6-dideoxygalactose transaminase